MKVVEQFLHLFTPRHTNNHKARLLHLPAITTYITVLLVLQIFLSGLARFSPGVLGYASNITVSDLLRYTNEKREAAGQPPLVLSEQLSKAAGGKAADMFAKQYWSHVAPDGRDPWLFIVTTGYNYLFAGENLARDFGDSKAVVEAWTNSASHRENLLNGRYQDIGLAVVNGRYNGYETTLVVQMFGAKAGGASTIETTPLTTVTPKEAKTPAPVLAGEAQKQDVTIPKIDIYGLTKNLSLGLIILLGGVLIIDAVLVSRRKIVRLSGHNLAHLLFLLAVLTALNLIGRGLIL